MLGNINDLFNFYTVAYVMMRDITANIRHKGGR